MDETTLRALIDSFNQQLASLEWWLHTWTVVVILGCAGEAVSIIREYRGESTEWFAAKLKAAVSLPHAPSWGWLVVDLISVAFVVIGIVGELSIDFQSSDLQTKLRDANANLVLLFEQEAGDAKKSAQEAREAAAKAKAEADVAKTTAGDAKTKSGEAKEVSRKALGDAIAAENRIEEAEAELALQGPRYARFAGKKRDEFRAALRPFVGQKLLIATRSNAGVEERQLGLLLFAMLDSSVRPSWHVATDNTQTFLSPEIMLGISKERATASTSKAAEALAKALGDVGISDINGGLPPRIEDFPGMPPDTIEIMIGEHIAISKRALDGSSK